MTALLERGDRTGAAAAPRDVGVAIVGSGFGGLGAATRLREAGIEDFVVLERAHQLGGTWRENTYPGCACDVPSHLYSFSFALNPDWSRFFAPQREILDYLRRIARERGITERIVFGADVGSGRWDEEAQRWLIDTSAGAVRARAVIAACGAIHTPALLKRSGLENPNIGKHLKLHPAAAVFGVFDEELKPWEGVMQALYSDQYRDLHDGYGLSTRPPPSIRTCSSRSRRGGARVSTSC